MQFSGKLKGTLILLIIIAASPLLFVNSKTVNEDNITINAGSKDWTVLVYMCGDNNLEYFALDDLNEMEAAGGTTADINIVTMIDRCEYDYETPQYPNDWSEARYYTIVGDNSPGTFTSPMNVSLGEVNMGEAQTLDDFIDWGLINYPSDKTALILWDHGGGLDGVCWDEDNGNDNLLVQEISDALDGYHFDFLGFDACVMGQFEVLYEMKDYCDIYVSSMLNEPGDGWDYYNTLTSLIADPSMDAAELAQHTCEDYVQSYSAFDVDVTLSAYNTSAFTDVDSLVDDFAMTLTATLDTYAEEVHEARIESNSELFPDAMCDLPDFLSNLQSIPDSAMTAAASALDAKLDEILVVSESSFI
ncbi:MAG: clostripain-related cysteine peptidase, partial [Candidatus Heimdallarchaeaceae archaeon]